MRQQSNLGTVTDQASGYYHAMPVRTLLRKRSLRRGGRRAVLGPYRSGPAAGR
jgi:hypothetical protein